MRLDVVIYDDPAFTDGVAVLRNGLVGGMLSVALQSFGIFDHQGEHGVVSHRAVTVIDANFQTYNFGYLAHEGFQVFFHPKRVLANFHSVGAIDEFPHDNVL